MLLLLRVGSRDVISCVAVTADVMVAMMEIECDSRG
jgi:hypothetical protein